MLRNWFNPETVGQKRLHIQQLLLQLMREQNIDVESLNLPDLNLSSQGSNSCYSEEYDFHDDEYYDDDEAGMDHPYYDDDGEEDGEDADERHRILERYHGYGGDSDDTEYIGDDTCESRYQLYDQFDDEDGDMHADSDENSEDEIYKDLDESESKTKKQRKVRTRSAAKEFPEGSFQDEETEDEDGDEEEEEESAAITTTTMGALSNERLRGVSKEDVTITQTMVSPANTRSRSAGNVANEATKSKTPSPVKNQRSSLRAARPFGDMDTTEDGCSSNKKFRPN